MSNQEFKSARDCYTLNNGVKIPCIGFGTWESAEGEECYNAVRWALEHGYRHIDTAAIYGNETSVGKAIKDSHIDRSEIFVTTKLWNGQRGSYDDVLRAMHDSLTRLGLEYVDLYLIHWPQPFEFRDRDWKALNAETWRAMEFLYRTGKARAIGVSNFREYHLDVLLKTAIVKPMVNQLFINPGDQDRDNKIFCEQNGMLVEAYSPLGRSALLKNEDIIKIAEKHSRTPAQIILRWELDKGYLPLPKSVHEERIASNLDLFDFKLDDDDFNILDNLNKTSLPLHRDPQALTSYKKLDFLK